MGFLSLQAINPPGTVYPFAGINPPSGYLLCDGSEVNRTTYNALFAAIGTLYGVGDSFSTFNLPDFRFQFLRGSSGIQYNLINGNGTLAANATEATFNGHGLVSGTPIKLFTGALNNLAIGPEYYVTAVTANTLAFHTTYANYISNTRINLGGPSGTSYNASITKFNIFAQGASVNTTAETITFTSNHNINRTGMRIRFTSGGTTPAPLLTTRSYYAIIVNNNTIAVADTYSDAINNTRINLTGTTITSSVFQYEDPDISTRYALSNSGILTGVGTRQEDQNLSHTHTVAVVGPTNAAASNARTEVGGGLVTSSPSGGFQANPINVYVNYIIKT